MPAVRTASPQPTSHPGRVWVGTALIAAVLAAALVIGARAAVAGPPHYVAAAPQNRSPVRPTPSSSLPFLHQSGTRIVDGAGRRVMLRGVDLGGWLLWEGWIFGGGYDSESLMMKRLSSLVGAASASRFHADVQRMFITEADIRAIARLGFNVIRVPFNYRVLASPANPFAYKPSGWRILDNLLNWAQKYRVYVVLDMHAAPGGQASGFVYDSTSPRLWGSTRDQDATVAMWHAIASRYRSRSVIAGYDLLNEPWPWPTGQALVRLYARTIAAIRRVDRRHTIILEGALDARDFSIFKAPLASNMAYSPHMYLWSQRNPQRQVAAYARMAKAQRVPLWVGEFGENVPSEVARQVAMFDAQPTVAGWSFYTWKQAYGLGVYQIPIPADWKALINWLCDASAPQPTVAQAMQGMRDFLHAIQLGNETQDSGVVSALSPRSS
jgi:Cellulase (glycosyl hydrolase family 5)